MRISHHPFKNSLGPFVKSFIACPIVCGKTDRILILSQLELQLETLNRSVVCLDCESRNSTMIFFFLQAEMYAQLVRWSGLAGGRRQPLRLLQLSAANSCNSRGLSSGVEVKPIKSVLVANRGKSHIFYCSLPPDTC